jgi:hypothetical protein
MRQSSSLPYRLAEMPPFQGIWIWFCALKTLVVLTKCILASEKRRLATTFETISNQPRRIRDMPFSQHGQIGGSRAKSPSNCPTWIWLLLISNTRHTRTASCHERLATIRVQPHVSNSFGLVRSEERPANSHSLFLVPYRAHLVIAY